MLHLWAVPSTSRAGPKLAESLREAARSRNVEALTQALAGVDARTLPPEDGDAAARALVRSLRGMPDARTRRAAAAARPLADACLTRSDVRPEHISMQLCVQTLKQGGSAHAAFESLRTRFPFWEPHREDWAFVVQALCRRGDADAALGVWFDMRVAGVTPRAAVANAMLTALLPSRVDDARDVVDDMGGIGTLDVVGLSILTNAFTKLAADGVPTAPAAGGSWDVHTAAGALRDTLARAANGAGAGDSIAWHTLLQYYGYFDGAPAAMRAARDALARGAFVPDAWTVSTLLLCHGPELAALHTSDAALDLLRAIYRATNVLPGRHAAAIVLRAVLGDPPHIGYDLAADDGAAATGAPADPNQVHEAHALYREARAVFGVEPDAALVQPLIEAYCNAFLPALEPACELLDDVLAEPPVPLLRRWAPRPRWLPPVDLGVFYPVLMACARLRDVDRACAVLRQLSRASVVVPPHAALALAQRLIAACATYAQAWDVYRGVRALRGLDGDAFARLLALFCRLALEDGAVPPEYPLEILGDMRGAGFHPSPQTYTILLDSYAKSPYATQAGVRATHALIQCDMHLEPDLVLIHALMNAYNHVGAPAQVLGIWDSLFVLCTNVRAPRFINDVTVTIVCDTCGRAGLLDVMRGILRSVRRLDAHLVSKNVLDAWVECLARCGRLGEAADVVFGEMCASFATRPDAKTLGTLLRFALNDPAALAMLRQRAQHVFPDVWPSVAAIGSSAIRN